MAGLVCIIHELPQGSRQGTVLTVPKSGIPGGFLFRTPSGSREPLGARNKWKVMVALRRVVKTVP